MGKGRNVTTDNFFTSLKLVEKLQAKGVSIVGTVNCIRREIPEPIRKTREKRYNSHIVKNNQCTLTMYQGKHTQKCTLTELHS